MKYICALIVVDDVKKSRHLFEDILGQAVTQDYGENVTFAGGFALHQKAHFEHLIGGRPVGKGANDFEIYFEHDNLEEIRDILKEKGLEFVHDIMEQPWRQKVLRFYDYDWHIIEIGESMEHLAWRLSREGLSTGEIIKTTYLDEATVINSIRKYSE